MTRRPAATSIRKRVAVTTAVAVLAAGTFVAGAGVAGADSRGSSAKKSAKTATKAQVLGLFDQWNAALQTGDPQKVADLYAKDAVLLPTVSNNVRTDRAEIVDYFEHFLQNKPVGTKVESVVNVLDHNTAIDAGVYEFALTDHETGAKSTVKARYTYAYEKQPNGTWLIVNHHSSKMPEG
ncbi:MULTISPECIES: SgcJ/EcaC family oxidoreductase [Streptomyces]|uniref:Calcium/calmodulin dependent protein kinase II Association n=1 Tax=Streptomyces chartreusis NRRL 3882 TaxID=1079985 RepID=A0A2N9BA24_STRCX|nr:MULTISPECIES: SgcJ/EcaC family oxidoreductase [Streptomyces]MYS91112.1 SgcJ/EcaC family oxidoreductase [Streptomyces sp. SID5464]SOR80202.1 Calcium/calmodulin dependent protein kinase II Association [Streptomyces chartreusis NRRL 3882]